MEFKLLNGPLMKWEDIPTGWIVVIHAKPVVKTGPDIFIDVTSGEEGLLRVGN